jgi:hypothetical protein
MRLEAFVVHRLQRTKLLWLRTGPAREPASRHTNANRLARDRQAVLWMRLSGCTFATKSGEAGGG